MSGTTIRGIVPDHVLRLMSKADRKMLGKGGITADEACSKAEVKQERELQNILVSLLSRNGIICNRSRMDKRKTDVTGWPDIVFAATGRAVAWEVKLPKKNLEPDQVECVAKMQANGWIVVVIRSYNEAMEHLKQLGVLNK